MWWGGGGGGGSGRYISKSPGTVHNQLLCISTYIVALTVENIILYKHKLLYYVDCFMVTCLPVYTNRPLRDVGLAAVP